MKDKERWLFLNDLQKSTEIILVHKDATTSVGDAQRMHEVISQRRGDTRTTQEVFMGSVRIDADASTGEVTIKVTNRLQTCDCSHGTCCWISTRTVPGKRYAR